MKRAFILAAGLGTRLRPWTLHHPKALVPVGGRPMLQRVIDRVAECGFGSVVVNVHHFADQIVDYLAEHPQPVEIAVSDETDVLRDTGGALLAASGLLFGDGCRGVLVHNVDILSNADLTSLYAHHDKSDADVTMLVSKRDSSRQLYFDADGNLRGWSNLKDGSCRPDGFVPDDSVRGYAFSGIYVIGPAVTELMRTTSQPPVFPIIDFLLNHRDDLKIKCFVAEDLRLIDIGKPETLAAANEPNGAPFS